MLGEEDPVHEDVERFKYLGFKISANGKCDDFINQKIKRCKLSLGQNWSFFTLANLSVDLKVRADHTLITGENKKRV